MHGSRHNLSGIVSGYQPEVSHASARCGRNLVLVDDARALLCESHHAAFPLDAVNRFYDPDNDHATSVGDAYGGLGS